MDNGGAVYIEGSNVGYSHHTTNFFDYLGADYLNQGGINSIDDIYGIDGTFTALNEFPFPNGDPDYKVDELSGGNGVSFLQCEGHGIRAILYDGGNYRAITSSITMGVLPDGEHSNTKALLMERYLRFLTGDDNGDIWYPGDEIDFGTTYAGYESVILFKVQNLGLSDLSISDIVISGTGFSIDCEPSYSIGIGEQVELPISFYSDDTGEFDGTLGFNTDDPDENPISISLSAGCLLPPVMEVSSTDMYAELMIGEIENQTLSILNTGNSDLSFYIDLAETDEIAVSDNLRMQQLFETITLAKGEFDYREGPPVICGSGGPDNFGYTWIDSDEPNGPEYEWFEISGIGQNSGLNGDDNMVMVSLPFEFSFYGATYDYVNVSTNGYLTFGTSGTTYTNAPIPNSSTPNNLICPFWDDLHQQSGTNYYYYDADYRRMIIQYDNWGYFGGGGNVTFQVHLCENGAIFFYYENMSGTTNSATVGIENSAGNDGLQIVYNNYYIQNNMAIRISSGPMWLSIDTDQAILPAGSSQDIIFTFDARGAEDGAYTASAIISSNDPAQQEMIIPVTMMVNPLGVDDGLLPYVTELKGNYPNPFNPSTTINFSLQERTHVTLDIFNVLGQKVSTLVDDVRDAGNHQVVWNADVATGIYFYRMIAGDYTDQQKMVLLK